MLSSALAAVALLSVAVQTQRWLSVWQYGDLHVVTGEEGPNFYVFWKILHGLPAYESPFQPPFSLSFYNFSFYYAYAFVMRIAGVDGAQIIFASRLISFLFALAGVAATAGIVRAAIDRPLTSREWALPIGICAVTWLGPGSTAWWSFSARPDMAALCFATIGVLCYVRHLKSDGLRFALFAGLAFCASWSFKQTTVGMLGGCAAYALFARRRLVDVTLLVAPTAALAALLLVFAAPAYWDNILWAPLVNPAQIALIPSRVLEVVLPNAFVYGIPLVAAITVTGRSGQERNGDESNSVIRMLIVLAVVTTMFGVVTIGKEGASRNYLFESLIVMSALSSIATTVRMVEIARSTLAYTCACALTVGAALLPGLTLMFPHVNSHGVHWNLVFVDRPRYEGRMALAAQLDAGNKPMFVRDDILSLPWHSTGGRYPAMVIDSLWHARAAEKGRLQSGGLVGVFRQQQYRTVVLEAGDPLLETAVASGYAGHRCNIASVGGNGRPVQLVVLDLKTSDRCAP